MPSTTSDRDPADGAHPSRRPAGPRPSRPALLGVACALVVVEVLGLLAAGVAGVVALVRGADVGQVLVLVVLAVGVAVLLWAAVRALWSGRRWGRGPVLTTQLFVGVLAVTWWGAGAGPHALAPLLVALTVVVALLTPAVVAVTSARGADGHSSRA